MRGRKGNVDGRRDGSWSILVRLGVLGKEASTVDGSPWRASGTRVLGSGRLLRGGRGRAERVTTSMNDIATRLSWLARVVRRHKTRFGTRSQLFSAFEASGFHAGPDGAVASGGGVSVIVDLGRMERVKDCPAILLSWEWVPDEALGVVAVARTGGARKFGLGLGSGLLQNASG